MHFVFTVIVILSISLTTTTSLILFARHPSTALNRYLNLHQRSIYHAFSTSSFSSALPAMSSSSDHCDSETHKNDNVVIITDLARFAIKGLSGDQLESVVVPKGGVQTFPDDRRFALLKQNNKDKFDEKDPEWLHKENFLCAFSAPELMACFQSNYEIVESDEGNNSGDDNDDTSNDEVQRLLTLYRRSGGDATSTTTEPVLGPIDLNFQSGRDELASFFSNESKEELVCVTKQTDGKVNTFQFGNTRAGVKNNPAGDTRTVHIVNRATIRELSDKIGLNLNAERFRPNIIIDGLDPWKEFDWVGRTLRVVSKGNNDDASTSSGGGSTNTTTLIMKVLTKTVRCEGIGIDPLDPSTGKIDVPKLLSKNYPEHGPYLGVYASLEVIDDGDGGGDDGKLLSVGDTLELL